MPLDDRVSFALSCDRLSPAPFSQLQPGESPRPGQARTPRPGHHSSQEALTQMSTSNYFVSEMQNRENFEKHR